MNTSVNTDDVIFNFFKQICDEKDDQKCVELGNCLLYTSPSPRDDGVSRMPSSA